MASFCINISYVMIYDVYIFNTIVHRLTCVNCNKSISYEGNEDGILYLRHHLITHSLLRDYMYHFVHGRYQLLYMHIVIYT
jgi:hypothetical protein